MNGPDSHLNQFVSNLNVEIIKIVMVSRNLAHCLFGCHAHIRFVRGGHRLIQLTDSTSVEFGVLTNK